ncbi:RecT family recombinase [Shouchella clausii]|uniref:RecT family recombinase n=1 Tax=Shouchella clausii TaxID=79880 RepID=UPI002896D0D5|nr:RecT family recombinase [Shouchella clausii]
MSNIQLTPEIQEAFQPAVIDTMRNSLCKGATDAEFVLFAHKAASYGLDPFKNEIFFIKYGNTARIQFAAEAYLAKAREKEGFQPPNTQMVHENDEFEVSMDEDGSLVVTKHKITFPRGKVIGAYSIAYRVGYRPVTVVMDVSEVEHMFKGQNKDNWQKYTSDMFGKHVQQRALKKQYGLDFGEDEPLSAAEQTGPYERTRKDITPDVTPEPEPEQTVQVEQTEEAQKNELKQQMKAKFKTLGITTKKDMADYIDTHLPNAGDNPSISELIALLEIMDMDIERREAMDMADLPE